MIQELSMSYGTVSISRESKRTLLWERWGNSDRDDGADDDDDDDDSGTVKCSGAALPLFAAGIGGKV